MSKKPGKRHRLLKYLKENMKPELVPPPAPEVVEPPVSPELAAKRKEAGILNNIFFILNNAAIKAAEAPKAVEILEYLNTRIVAAEAAVEAQLALEAPPAPVQAPPTVDAPPTPGASA